jgi:predicted nucleotidyltransferase
MKAIRLMTALKEEGVNPFIHGSVVRGDVDEESDIDVILDSVVPSYRIELALSRNRFKISSRKIVQATPSHSPKAHICLDPEERLVVTFPMIPFRTLEWDFYRFGGLLTLAELTECQRAAGVTRRLTLIEPTKKGHIVSAVEGREEQVAKILGVSTDIVHERVRVLKRRDRIGRTGVFILRQLRTEEQFEAIFKRLSESNPEMRRRQRMTK